MTGQPVARREIADLLPGQRATAEQPPAQRAPATDRRAPDPRLLVRLLGRARSYWPHIAGIFLIGLLATPLALLAPVPLKIVVDSVLAGQPVAAPLAAVFPDGASQVDLLLLAVALVVVIGAATQLHELAWGLLRTWTAEKLVQDFRAQLFRHVQRLSFAPVAAILFATLAAVFVVRALDDSAGVAAEIRQAIERRIGRLATAVAVARDAG